MSLHWVVTGLTICLDWCNYSNAPEKTSVVFLPICSTRGWIGATFWIKTRWFLRKNMTQINLCTKITLNMLNCISVVKITQNHMCSNTNFPICRNQGPLLLISTNLNPSMDKWLHAHRGVKWNYLSIPKLHVTVDVWEWISNFIPYFIMGVITCPCWDLT